MPFTPIFGVLDITNNQLFYLCIINFISTIVLLFKSEKEKIGISNPIIIYSVFIISAVFSIGYTEYFFVSLKELNIYVIIFFSLINLYLLIKTDKSNLNLFKYIFLILLTIEVGIIQYRFISEFSLLNPLGRDRMLQGISFNLNIASFSILIKIPILFLFLMRTSSLKKLFLSILLFTSIFTLLILSSRGAILGYGFLSVAIVIFLFFSFKEKNKKRKVFNLFIINIVCGITAIMTQNFLYQNQQSLKATERVQNFSGNSVKMRIGFYKDAIDHFLNEPLFGSGIGTWKILGINYHKDEMVDYQVPYHTHNDFLQILTEVGLIGLSIYLLIFIYLIYKLLKLFFSKRSDVDKDLIFFIIAAIGIYLWDANINFPRVRALSQLNLIYILSASFFIIKGDKEKFYSSRTLLTFILITQPILLFYNYKLIQDSKNQVRPYVEYNSLKKLTMPLEDVLMIDDTFSPINSVTVPIKNVKANYLIENEKYEQAIKYAREGKKQNPYLFMAENQIATSYYKMNELDSAVYYGKIAFDSLPNNLLHATTYQQTLYGYDDFEFARKEYYRIYDFFETTNNKRIEQGTVTLYENLLKFFIISDSKIKINEKDRKIASDIVKRFPNKKTLLKLNSVIQKGTLISNLSTNFENKAKKLFENKEFDKAISIWEKAVVLIPTEESYYLNLAQSYIALSQIDKALEYLKNIEEIEIKGDSGKYEFLLALCNIELNNISRACSLLKRSNNMGYNNAYGVLKALNCL